MKLASIRLTTRDVPALTKFYEKLTGGNRSMLFRDPDGTLVNFYKRAL